MSLGHRIYWKGISWRTEKGHGPPRLRVASEPITIFAYAHSSINKKKTQNLLIRITELKKQRRIERGRHFSVPMWR